MKKLVKENKNGAYLGMTPEFLRKFVLKESNPNFEVYDLPEGNNRFIPVKSPRLPDDNDFTVGRYGINFHRAKPDFETAKAYDNKLKTKRISQQELTSLAFAASTKEEYNNKSVAWDKFYTYVWGETPQNLWITPHSGNINRKPDILFPFPKLELDAYVAGVAARCAYNDTNPSTKRTMMSIHSHNWYSAVVDLGGFGINTDTKLETIAARIEEKYAEKVQPAAEACRRNFAARIMPWLEIIQNHRGTLNPKKMPEEDGIARSVVFYAATGLKLYHKELTRFTLKEFQDALNSLKGTRARVASCQHLFSGQKISQQLEIASQIQRGRLDAALQIECMKFYLKKTPELVADIILDIKHELLNEK
jgi:hypothetical protein